MEYTEAEERFRARSAVIRGTYVLAMRLEGAGFLDKPTLLGRAVVAVGVHGLLPMRLYAWPVARRAGAFGWEHKMFFLGLVALIVQIWKLMN